MAKGKRKDWRHRVTRQELAERKFIDQQVDRIVVEAHAKAIYAVIDAHRARMEEATAWVKDFVPKMAEAFAQLRFAKASGFVSEESLKRIFGDQYMPLGSRGAIVGDTFVLHPAPTDVATFAASALAQAEINKYGKES